MKIRLVLLLLFFAAVVFAAAQNNYSTLFPLVQNPISEGGNWTNAGAPYAGMQSFGGHIGGTNTQPGCSGHSPDNNCNDSNAALSGTWTSDQAACATVFIAPGANRATGHYEIELHLRKTISTGQSRGYEFNYSLNTSGPYGGPVRWDGVVGGKITFVSLFPGFVNPPVLNNGDVICASAIGSTLKEWMLRNGVLMVSTTVTDATYTGGAPGIGVYNAGVIADAPNFGWSEFEATNLVAQTANRNDVNSVLNGPLHTAVEGESVLIPPGSITWTSGVTVPAGIGVGIFGYGVPNSTPATTTPSASCSQTNLTLQTNNAAAFIATPGVSSLPRLSCMVQTYGGSFGGATNGAIGFSVLGTCNGSGCTNFRFDNITWPNWGNHAGAGISYGINAMGDVFGVADHNSVTGVTTTYLHLVEINNASYKGVGLYGDNSWAQPENYGSNDFFFFENNSFTSAGCCENEGNAGGLTHQGGNRTIARFNTWFLSDGFNTGMAWHGTESSGRPRGGRAFEFYRNTINSPATCVPSGNCDQYVAVRSGTGLVWGQTLNFQTTHAGGIKFNTNRTTGTTGNWPACDGTATQDANDGAGVQFSGTIQTVVAGPSNLSWIVTVNAGGSGTTPPWSTNQWSPVGAPYSMHDVTISAVKLLAVGSEIQSNTSNVLTLSALGGPANFTPVAGDSIQITRAFSCIDQGSGRGAGVLVSGGGIPAGPMNEVTSPSYMWMNTFTNQNPGDPYVGSNTLRTIANRDWYAETVTQTAQTSPTSPFNGATGAGHGTKIRRPTTCTTGVAYWATDEGNWNQSGNGQGQGNLYICTATNTWTLSYTPACFPHFLTTGGVSACGAGTPGIGLSPSSLAFGTVLVGNTSPVQTISLTNTGTALLNINSININGTNPTDFAQSNNCGTGVSVGGSCTISVTCTPLSAASFSANISISDNAAGSPHTAGLTCTGSTATAGISFAPTSVTFAARTVGTSSAPTAVTVNSTGSGNLVITQVQVVGGNNTSFTQTNNCGTVAPAGTCTINVTFSPKVAGALSSTICATDNAPASPQCFPVNGTGNGVPGIAFNPTSLAFGNQAVSTTSADMIVTVSNPGTALLTISSVVASGDFAIHSTTCGGTLAINATCTYNVDFTPTVPGARTGNLTFTDTAAGSPQVVALTGNGTQSATSFSPTSLAFGNQNVGTPSSPLTTTLTNTGSTTLNISGIVTDLADYVISAKTCGATLGASATCTVSVVFTPSASGARSGNLLFTDDAPGSPQSVPLTGNGVVVSNTLNVTPTSLAFPATKVGISSASQTISLQANIDNPSPITITSIVASGGNAGDFIVTNNCPATLTNSCTVTVVFHPTTTGARASSVVITSSAAQSPQTVTLSGTGTQSGALLSPLFLAFGNQPVGTSSATQAVTLTNNGTATLNVTSINIGGTNASYFSKTGSCGFTLGPGLNCNIVVTFTPQTAIAASAVLVFTDDGPGSPQNIPLTGTGTTQSLSFSPTSVTFPNTAVSVTSAGIVVTMSNTGNGPTTISSIVIGGTNNGDFSQTNNCGASLGGGSSCSITAKFTPTTTGVRNANITFTDTAPGSPQTVSLQGTGFTPAPAVSLSVSSVSFGNQTVGTQSNNQVVILTNTGTASLTISTATLGGANPGDFGFSTTCGGTLAVNVSCTYSIHFTPTIAGSRAANFNVNTNAASTPDVVTLTGTGVASPPGAPAPQVFGF